MTDYRIEIEKTLESIIESDSLSANPYMDVFRDSLETIQSYKKELETNRKALAQTLRGTAKTLQGSRVLVVSLVEVLKQYADGRNWLGDDSGYFRLWKPGEHGDSLAKDALAILRKYSDKRDGT